MIVRRPRLSSVPPFPAPSPTATGQMPPTECTTEVDIRACPFIAG